MSETSKMVKALLADENTNNAANYKKTGSMSLAMSGFVNKNDNKPYMLKMECPPEQSIPRLLDPDKFPKLESSPVIDDVLKRCQQNYIKAAKPQNGNDAPGR